MSALSCSKAAFVFRYLFERSIGSASYHCEVSLSYDDGMDFVVSFGEMFPGRCTDTNHVNAQKRLYALAKRLVDDGWLDRWRVSNHDQYHPRNEPNWQYVYALKPCLLRDLRSGKLTPESAAERWGG